MTHDKIILTKAAWMTIWRWTLLIVLGSVALSVLATIVVLDIFSDGVPLIGLFIAIVMPMVLGGPMMFFLLFKQQQYAVINERLHVMASTDWLTACLNRRAFTHQVTKQLSALARSEGAFLVIDADHFKNINDAFGHDCGDGVLQMLADAIKSSVRAGDLVGRIGGEEFGVFLKDANLETAREVAERIRAVVRTIEFAPSGGEHQLSVSVGGVSFDAEIGFTELFRLADQRLYSVKQTGRNRSEVVNLTPLRSDPPVENAAA